ncbi:unnamed protein product [Pedinophyceae sp. YPF-701]|nr:unnamed protein product [Pedinophyceae sp. YPF-701]
MGFNPHAEPSARQALPVPSSEDLAAVRAWLAAQNTEAENVQERTTDTPTSRRPRVLLGLTGSVASIKAAQLCAGLAQFAEIRVVATTSAQHFIAASGDRLPKQCLPILTDGHEWALWQRRGDPVLHVELRKWADALVIAPLSANTLAKLASGLCDDLLSCVVRAWDWRRPVLVAPAMNTLMWASPCTDRQLSVLRGLGARVVEPVTKVLMCGDAGAGAMAEPSDVVKHAKALFEAGVVSEQSSGVGDMAAFSSGQAASRMAAVITQDTHGGEMAMDK